MLDLSVIHRPGIVGGAQNLGRILEAMLYYDRVHLIISAQMFTGFWDALGPVDTGVLLGYPSITATFTPEFLAMQNETGAAVVTHRPAAFKLSGREGRLLDPKDNVGSLVQALDGLPNRPGGTRAEVKRILKLGRMSNYAKILGGDRESRERLLSLVKDQETLKLFLRGWATAHGKFVDEHAVDRAEIEVIDFGEKFMVASSEPLERMIPTWDSNESWGAILNGVQDYAVDLYLSQAHSADVISTPEVSAIAGARIDISLQRALRNSQEISAFEEMVFDGAHGFADAYNNGLISLTEALKVIDQSRRFRTWAKGLAPDANLINEYHKAITKDTILGRLPASLARFAFFNGAGILADAAAPGAGWATSAFDTFILDRLVDGWRPNFFVRNMQKTLAKAERRASREP